MRNLIRTLSAGMVAAVLIACGSQSEPTQVGAEDDAQNPPPQAVASKPDADRVSSARTLPDSVARLFSRMDAVGPGSQEAYDSELTAFLRSPNPAATLQSVYRQLPTSALGARWKTIHAAGQIRTPEAVAFLSEVALSPPEISASAKGHDGGDQSFRLRYTASIGVVKNLLARIDTAEGATARLLGEADREVAQLLGVELFSEGLLRSDWKSILSARGISAQFERLEGAELEAVRSVGPQTPHQGADVRTRPRMTSVPAIQENE